MVNLDLMICLAKQWIEFGHDHLIWILYWGLAHDVFADFGDSLVELLQIELLVRLEKCEQARDGALLAHHLGTCVRNSLFF